MKSLIAAAHTPFDEKGKLQLSVIPEYASYLKKSGLNGVFVNGTTGEGVSLSREERIETAAAWLDQQSDDFRVLVHVGHNSIAEAQTLAEHAQEHDASGIAAMSPTYFKPNDAIELVRFNAQIAASASSIPFYYYHFPALTDVHISVRDFLAQVLGDIPNLKGVKFTHYDLMDLKLSMEFSEGRFEFFFGLDEILLSALILGVSGAVGSTFNYMAHLLMTLVDHFENRRLEEAKECQIRAMKIINVIHRYGGSARVGKTILRNCGLNLGQPRLPLRKLSIQEESSFLREIQELGFDQYTIRSLNSAP